MSTPELDHSCIEGKVREFISANFLFGKSADDIAIEDSFLEKGLLDSTGVLELTTFVEDTFQITVEDVELVPENMDSIGQLVAFVERKLVTTG